MTTSREDSRTIVAVVDDDADDRSFLQSAFSEIDHFCEVRFYPDSIIFLRSLLISHPSEMPSIAILDWNMPRLDGGQLVKEIRKDQRFDRVFIVIFSTAAPIDRQYFLSMGANDVVAKPRSYSQLVEHAKAWAEACD